MSDINKKYEKRLLALRYFLLGRGYFVAVAALEFALTYHTGTRKDGVTPEFFHQVSIASYIRTLPIPEADMEVILAAAFLHDVVEDYPVSLETIRVKFGTKIAEIVRLMTNKEDGIKLPKELYYARFLCNVLSAALKGSDRVHNFQSMPGVFTPEKQLSYIKEGEEFIIPMLKKARRAYPAYEAVFENIKLVLESQIQLIKAALPKTEGA